MYFLKEGKTMEIEQEKLNIAVKTYPKLYTDDMPFKISDQKEKTTASPEILAFFKKNFQQKF